METNERLLQLNKRAFELGNDEGEEDKILPSKNIMEKIKPNKIDPDTSKDGNQKKVSKFK